MTRIALAIATGLLFAGAPVAAQDPAAAQPQDTAQPVPPQAVRPVTTFEDGHPSFRLGALRLDLHGRIQTDVRRSDAAIGDASDVDLSRKRIGLEAEVGRLSLEFDAELADDRPWRDAFADYRVSNALRIQGGQFKVPFSREATTSTVNIDFPYRSQAAAQLAPGREAGVMVHGRLWRRRLMYEAGAFTHVDAGEPGDLTSRVGRTTAVRLSSAPFARSRSALAELEAGVAVAVSTLDEGVSDLKGRTALGETLFDSVYWVRGLRQRVGVEARWEPGPFSVAAEYMRVSDERREQGLAGADLPALVAQGWYVSGTWLLTGERKASDISPRRSVLRGGLGAIEAAVRVETLRFGDPQLVAPGLPNPRAEEIPGGQNRVVTAGLNWYLHRSIKVQAHLIREILRGESAAALGQSAVMSQVFRLQFAL